MRKCGVSIERQRSVGSFAARAGAAATKSRAAAVRSAKRRWNRFVTAKKGERGARGSREFSGARVGCVSNRRAEVDFGDFPFGGAGTAAEVSLFSGVACGS